MSKNNNGRVLGRVLSKEQVATVAGGLVSNPNLDYSSPTAESPFPTLPGTDGTSGVGDITFTGSDRPQQEN